MVTLEQARNQFVLKLDSGAVSIDQGRGFGALLRNLGQVLGVFFAPLSTVEREGLTFVGGREGAEPLSCEEIGALLASRSEARAAKDFAKADEVRARLAKGGVEILDTKAGTSWRFLAVAK
jgi:cysteinyl-tRNA synthetase